MSRVFCLMVLAMFFIGCSHNPAIFTVGKRTNIGFDPAQMAANVSWSDGLNVIDIPRENSSWEMEVDEGTGLSFDTATNTLRGVRKVTRKTGIQITGYLVDLAEKSPEAAVEYIKQASAMQSADGTKLSAHLVTLPLQQSNGVGLSKIDFAKVKEIALADKDEVVPDGLDMSLEDWKLLKASYIECPECLILSDIEASALEKATGIKFEGDVYKSK